VLGVDLLQLPYTSSDMLNSFMCFLFISIVAIKVYAILEYITLKSNLFKPIIYTIKYWPLLLLSAYIIHPAYVMKLIIKTPALLMFVVYWLLCSVFLEFKSRYNFYSKMNSHATNIVVFCLSMVLASVNAYIDAKLDLEGLRVFTLKIELEDMDNKRDIRVLSQGMIRMDKTTNELYFIPFNKGRPIK
jgi:hypothetical protein